MGHPTNRAERRAQRLRIVINRLHEVLEYEKPREWDEWSQRCLESGAKNRKANARGDWFSEPGKFHKKKPYDCGRVRCKYCHFEKFHYPKAKRLQAKREFRKLLRDLEL